MPGAICPEGLQVAPAPSGRDEARDRTRSRKPSPELGEEPKKSRTGGRRSKVSPGGALQERRPRWSGHFLTRSEEHTTELQSLMRISNAVSCLNKTPTQR